MTTRFKLFKKIIDGLIYIHAQNIKHLDIKPANVLIITDAAGIWNEDDCVITDFGIASDADRETGLAGTPGFASPEQLIGTAGMDSDKYSFGMLSLMLFSDWPTFWSSSFQPISEQDLAAIQIDPAYVQLFDAIKTLIRVRNYLYY